MTQTRISFRSRRFQILAATGLVATLVYYASIRRWAYSETTVVTAEMFPDDLPVVLKEDIAQARQRIQRYPTAESWGSLGELCVAHKLLPQAESCFQKASSLAPDNPKWVYQMAVMAEKVDLVRAIELYDKVLSLDRSVEAVHYHRGRALARIGRLDEAEQSLKTADEMSQQHPLVLKAMAQLRMMQGDSDGAFVLIKKAVSDSRAGFDIVEEAKRLLIRQSPDDFTAAPLSAANSSRPQVTTPLPEPWMEGVARHLPHVKEIAAHASALSSQQQHKAAMLLYERLMRMEDRNSRAATAHAVELMNGGNVSQALEEMKKVCKEFPQDALAFRTRGAIEFRVGDTPAAIQSFDEAVRLKPDFVDVHRALLLIFQLQKQTERIEAQFRILLALVPADEDLRAQYETFQNDCGQQPNRK